MAESDLLDALRGLRAEPRPDAEIYQMFWVGFANWHADIHHMRPSCVDGRWTVGAWALVDGRVVNGGVRLGF